MKLIGDKRYYVSGCGSFIEGEGPVGKVGAELTLEDSIRINSGIFGDWRKYSECWKTFDSMLDSLDRAAVNVGANISHNAIRQYACGFVNEPLTGEKLKTAKVELRNAFQAGATGFSVGLSYYPGGYSNTEELVELCSVVQEEGGVFCASPNPQVGRGFKTGKEELAGFITALELFVRDNQEARYQEQVDMLRRVEECVTGFPGVRTEIKKEGRLGTYQPLLLVLFPRGITGERCNHFMRNSKPAIDIGVYQPEFNMPENSIFVNAYNLKAGEDRAVGEALKKFLETI
ncbi:MAG: hypothetical protein ACRC3H_15120 [Lachnospiraceae bacterium]